MTTKRPTPIAASATIALDAHEIDLLIDALDSHVYWELSDREFRSSGYVLDPGAFDAEDGESITRSRALAERLEQERRALTAQTRA